MFPSDYPFLVYFHTLQVCEDPTLAGTSRYTPYESPLKQFKSYRYHPEYLAEVPRGFRSLTYSHGIDPHKPLCRYELAGGVCNDDLCEGQHVRNMGLSGASNKQ